MMGEKPDFWPSFGSVVRGLRLGWRWSNKYQCFIRLSDIGKLFCLEVAPDKGVPAKGVSGDGFRCWWDNPKLLDDIKPLQGLKVTTYQVIYLDDEGERVSR
jgi:hypothetical protein